jgi:hypothetical protein
MIFYTKFSVGARENSYTVLVVKHKLSNGVILGKFCDLFFITIVLYVSPFLLKKKREKMLRFASFFKQNRTLYLISSCFKSIIQLLKALV